MLKELEESGEYVFHGSGLWLDVLEPRQAYTRDRDTQKRIPDGIPSVFASHVSDYAAFMALVNKINCPRGHRARVSFQEESWLYFATKLTLMQLSQETTGYVHVLDRSFFTQRNTGEWVTHSPLKPLLIVKVSLSDFQPRIHVMGTNKLYEF